MAQPPTRPADLGLNHSFGARFAPRQGSDKSLEAWFSYFGPGVFHGNSMGNQWVAELTSPSSGDCGF